MLAFEKQNSICLNQMSKPKSIERHPTEYFPFRALTPFSTWSHLLPSESGSDRLEDRRSPGALRKKAQMGQSIISSADSINTVLEATPVQGSTISRQLRFNAVGVRQAASCLIRSGSLFFGRGQNEGRIDFIPIE
jgi:hypothetical protein